ncbi:MAG: hypothetical protein AB1403_06005 [Candidatus Riflebacteria bacterium]
MRFKCLFKFSFCLFLFLSVVNLANAGPLDKIVEFYTSSVPNPAEVKIDVLKVMELAETGDIIIENNIAFPQWYAAIGILVPGTRYVHAGMVVKGHALKQYLQKLDPQNNNRNAKTAHVRCLQTNKDANGKPYKVWEWVRAPIDPNAKYVITPEVTRGRTLSSVVALHLKHYLLDPAIGYSTKHIKVLRPPVQTQPALEKMIMYLCYHVLKKTEYDMGFSIDEPEPLIFRKTTEGITADISVAPVPLYCTELLWRALKQANCEADTVKIGGGFGDFLRKIKRMPKSLATKITAPFVTADLFINHTQTVYANAAPPSVGEVIRDMRDKAFKKICEDLKENLAKIFKRSK